MVPKASRIELHQVHHHYVRTTNRRSNRLGSRIIRRGRGTQRRLHGGVLARTQEWRWNNVITAR